MLPLNALPWRMEPTEERKARLKALRAEAESCGLVPARCADDECAAPIAVTSERGC